MNISKSALIITIFLVAWIGTISTVTGALLVASGIFNYGYTLFLIGAVSWFAVAVFKRDTALGCLNACYIIINIYGFLNLGL